MANKIDIERNCEFMPTPNIITKCDQWEIEIRWQVHLLNPIGRPVDVDRIAILLSASNILSEWTYDLYPSGCKLSECLI